jgi:hypothetical protein
VGAWISHIGTNADLKRDAFLLTKEKPVAPAVYTVGGDHIVAALKERVKGKDDEFNQQKANLIQQAEQRRKNQVMEDFVNYLKARSEIHLNNTYLASVGESGRPLDRPLARN